MLRELIPHSDQKRDKASFLLEVHSYETTVFILYKFSIFLVSAKSEIFLGH